MSIMVRFNKARGQYLIKCLASGTPIEPEGDGWTGNEMLALAGACFFGALSHGPESWGRDIPENLHPEHQEAEEGAFFNDLNAAIEFYGHLTRLVKDDEYDHQCDPDVLAVVTQDGDAKTVRPISGMRAPGAAN